MHANLPHYNPREKLQTGPKGPGRGSAAFRSLLEALRGALIPRLADFKRPLTILSSGPRPLSSKPAMSALTPHCCALLLGPRLPHRKRQVHLPTPRSAPDLGSSRMVPTANPTLGTQPQPVEE